MGVAQLGKYPVLGVETIKSSMGKPLISKATLSLLLKSLRTLTRFSDKAGLTISDK